jgi:hypothetical protein
MLHDETVKRGSQTQTEASSTYANFDETKIKLLTPLHTIKFCMSLLTFDTEFKNRLFSAGWSETQTEKIKHVLASEMTIHATLWAFGDLEMLKRDLDTLQVILSKRKSQGVGVGLSMPFSTRYSNPLIKSLAKKAMSKWYESVELFARYFPSSDYIYADLSKIPSGAEIHHLRLTGAFDSRIDTACLSLAKQGVPLDQTAFVTTKACIKYAKKRFPDLNFLCAKNNYFGGTICTPNLFVFDDIVKAIRKSKQYNYYVLNKEMLCGNADQTGRPVESFQKEVGKQVIFL